MPYMAHAVDLYMIILMCIFWQGGRREVVAVKCVDKTSLNKVSTENLLTEIELLKRLRHDHIVELKDFQVGAAKG